MATRQKAIVHESSLFFLLSDRERLSARQKISHLYLLHSYASAMQTSRMFCLHNCSEPHSVPAAVQKPNRLESYPTGLSSAPKWFMPDSEGHALLAGRATRNAIHPASGSPKKICILCLTAPVSYPGPALVFVLYPDRSSGPRQARHWRHATCCCVSSIHPSVLSSLTAL